MNSKYFGAALKNNVTTSDEDDGSEEDGSEDDESEESNEAGAHFEMKDDGGEESKESGPQYEVMGLLLCLCLATCILNYIISRNKLPPLLPLRPRAQMLLVLTQNLPRY